MTADETRIAGLVDAMTLAEQVSLLAGADFWSLPAIERLGIGRLRVSDGPNGARGGGSLVGGVKAAAFPVGIALGATWNPALAQEIGVALADEVKSKGAHVLLAPTVNIHRSVTNGRNFECYSEDPVLTAALAVGYITGLQSQGIGATIKHFIGNESEVQRTTISSEIDERTLREVYLLPFEAAVKRAGVWAVMSSYNRLGGTYTSEHGWLLNTVLRGDWGFDGVVMSDWFGSHATADTVNNGLDLEMPGPSRDRGDKLVAAVAAGTVSAATVRGAALNILRLMARTGALDDHRPHVEQAIDDPAHRALIRRAGAEGAVLLANDGILPLASGVKVAVIGPNARVAQIMGGGSAQINAHYQVSIWDGLSAAVGEAALIHAPGCSSDRFQPVLRGPFKTEFFANTTLSGAPVHLGEMPDAMAFWLENVADGKVKATEFSVRLTGSYTAEASSSHVAGIRSAGFSRMLIDGVQVAEAWESWAAGETFFEEGSAEMTGTLDLKEGQTCQVVIEFATKPPKVLAFAGLAAGIGRPLGAAGIAEAVAAARNADVALVCVGRNADWDGEGADLPHITLPGDQNALIAAVAAVNPRTVVVLQTGGPVEMPWAGDVAAILQAWYPGQEAGNAVADVLLGHAEPGGRLPQTFPLRWQDNPTRSQDPEIYPGLDGRVRYGEGVFVGYRHYQAQGIDPLYAFGHGLSYTSFALSECALHGAGTATPSVSLRVTNTGSRAGSEVVQLYVTPTPAPVPRPLRELKAFAKLHLAAGESRTVTLALTRRDFAWFDVVARHWVVSAGRYGVTLARHAGGADWQASVNLAAAAWPASAG